jgi:hypothetical protein
LREPIRDEDLIRAKNQLKMGMLDSLECSERRLEEMAKNYLVHNDLLFH